MSRWEYSERAHNGMRFLMWTCPDGRAEWARGDTKTFWDFPSTLKLVVDQTKYGDELIVDLRLRGDGVSRARVSEEWDRMQIYCGKADEQAAEVLEAAARTIRQRIAPQA